MKTGFTEHPSYLQVLFGVVPYQLTKIVINVYELVRMVLFLLERKRGIMIERRGDLVFVHTYADIFGQRIFLECAMFYPDQVKQLAEAFRLQSEFFDGSFSKRHGGAP